MRPPHLKTRVVLPLVSALVLLLGATAGGIAWLEHRNVKKELQFTLQTAEQEWHSRVQSQSVAMGAVLPFICDDRRLIDCFLTRARSRLAAFASPMFERLKKTGAVHQLTFYDPGFIVVLRVHQPEAHSDRAEHPALRQARQNRAPAAGLVADAKGQLSICAVRPWIVAGRTIGYVEAATDVDALLDQVGKTVGAGLCVLVDRDQPQTPAQRLIEGDAAGEGFRKETLAAQTFDRIPTELSAMLADGPAGRVSAAPLSLIADGRRFHVAAAPVTDAAEKRIGRLVVVRDTTAFQRDTRIVTAAVIGLCGLTTILFFWLIYRSIRRLQKRLQGTQAQLLFDVHHDPLTGLPNRRKFISHLDAVIRHTQESKGRAFALLFLDFDRFRLVNDCLGHELGDLLLQAVASRLRKALSQTRLVGVCTAGRFGGDQFVILVDPLAAPGDAVVVAEQVLKTLAEPYNVNGHEIHSSVSIGITTSEVSKGVADEVLRDAEAAMHRAKLSGHGRAETFEPPMRSATSNRLEMERDLARAIERKELRLFYQPIVRMADAKLVGFEGLVRWQHPIKGMISPADFIPMAEETGLILPLGMWVLEEGCRQIRDWRYGYPELDLTMSLNLSRKQLCFPDLVDRVEKLIVDNALPAASLKLEITESTVMEHGTAAIGVLQALRGLGVHLLMDDFGTGYSSLSCLHRFPLNGIKVDRAFIRNVSERRDYVAVVHAIVSLARNLGMQVIAEGVETEDQVAMLKGLDCDLAQGYFFSKPVDAKTAEAFIQKHTPLSRAA